MLTEKNSYREFYERLAREHGDMDHQYYGPGGTSGGWGDRLLDHVIRRLPKCDGVFADIGCADGRLLVKLASRIPKRVGLGISSVRLARARTKLCACGGSSVFVQGLLEAMPIASGSVSLATCMETLEHVLGLESALAELRRILVPRGHLFIGVPSVTLRSYWEMYRLRRPFYCDEDEHLREFTTRPVRWFPNKFVLISDLDAQLARHGFNVVERSGVGYLFPRWADRTALTRWAFDLVYTRHLNPLFGYIPFVRRFPKRTVYHLVAV